MMERKQSNIGFNHLLFFFFVCEELALGRKGLSTPKLPLLQVIESKAYNFEERKKHMVEGSGCLKNVNICDVRDEITTS